MVMVSWKESSLNGATEKSPKPMEKPSAMVLRNLSQFQKIEQ